MSLRVPLSTRWIALALGLWAAAPLSAEEIPDLTLRYRELAGREELKFRSLGQADAKPAGLLTWEFPPTGFATVGFESAPRTYCIEPQVPVVPGTDYPFRIEAYGHPRDFGLKANDDGKKAADRRLKFVRELYGRYYTESVKDPAAQAAFQTALWEVVAETDVPDGPMPFNLFAGTFKADYPNEAASPAFVKTAQKYVQSLTGDDAAFSDNPELAGRELVRLTGMKNTAGATGQSQLALRNRAGSSNITGPFGDTLGNTGGSGGGLAALAGLGRAPSLGGLGGGFGGGGGGGGFFGGGGTSTTATTSVPTTTSPTTVTPTSSVSTTPTTNPSGSTSSNPGTNTQNPGGNTPNPNPTPEPTPNPVPAPPAVILGGVAIALFGLRKVLARKAV